MASSMEFVEFVMGQLSDAGEITFKRMFGEFGIYLDGKYLAGICDNTLFFKITEAGKKVMPEYETGAPYAGASPAFVISDLDDKEFLKRLAQATWTELPFPKPRKKKEAKS